MYRKDLCTMNLIEDKIQNFYKILASLMAIFIGTFHLLNVSGILVVSSMPLRVIHLMVMISIAFLTRLKIKSKGILTQLLKGIGVLLSFSVGIYILSRWKAIIESGGVTNNIDTYNNLEIIREGVGFNCFFIPDLSFCWSIYAKYFTKSCIQLK